MSYAISLLFVAAYFLVLGVGLLIVAATSRD